MNEWSIGPVPEKAEIPSDLAEWTGAVRLTHLALEAVQTVEAPLTKFQMGSDDPGYGFRMLLTLLTYAYSRGAWCSEEIEERIRSEFDFRYLATSEFPEATTLRYFRRREWPRLHRTLSNVLRAVISREEAGCWFDADQEAARRLEAAAAADSLALDC